MIRYAILGLCLGIGPTLAQTPPASNMARLQDCLTAAAAKFDDHISDASVIADRISGVCVREWNAIMPIAHGISGTALAEWKAKVAQNQHDVAVAAVLAGRGKGQNGQ